MTCAIPKDNDFLLHIFHELEEIKGVVRTSEYEEFLRKYDYSSTTARKYADQFDPDNDGCITKEHIYRCLGFSNKYRPLQSIPHDVSIISSDMGPYQQLSVVRLARQSGKYFPDMKEVVMRLKSKLDSLYGLLWHVFIVRGQYWAYYSHDSRTGMVFKHEDLIYVMYKTPNA